MHLFHNKTMDWVVSYRLGVTVNSHEKVTCKENLFLNLSILNIYFGNSRTFPGPSAETKITFWDTFRRKKIQDTRANSYTTINQL